MKRIMSLLIKSLVAILVVGGTFATSAQAQNDLAVTANIPFQFTVGKQSIAPGTYQFILEPSLFRLYIVDVKNGHEKLFAVRPEQERAHESRGNLVFHKSEDDRVLNEIHFPGTGTFIQMIQPHSVGKIEAKKSSPSDSVSVAQR